MLSVCSAQTKLVCTFIYSVEEIKAQCKNYHSTSISVMLKAQEASYQCSRWLIVSSPASLVSSPASLFFYCQKKKKWNDHTYRVLGVLFMFRFFSHVLLCSFSFRYTVKTAQLLIGSFLFWLCYVHSLVWLLVQPLMAQVVPKLCNEILTIRKYTEKVQSKQ